MIRVMENASGRLGLTRRAEGYDDEVRQGKDFWGVIVDRYGFQLEVIGGPRMDNMYHAGWAWAGNTPFRYTKLVASDFGGTRTPMVISWPARIRPDDRPRTQFHHVNDLAPTLYELLGIRPPDVVDGHPQDPIDGVSFAYTFDDPDAPERKQTQYFEMAVATRAKARSPGSSPPQS